MAFDRQIATLTIVMEASNQTPEARLGVAFVLRNRVANGRWGSTLAEVCLAPLQFSCWNTSDRNRHRVAGLADTDSEILAAEDAFDLSSDSILNGRVDPTNGATHYFDDSIPTPSWAHALTRTAKIDRLTFYK